MIKWIVFFSLIISTNKLSSQISLDSLRTVVSMDSTLTCKKQFTGFNYGLERYFNQDSLLEYQFITDKHGQIDRTGIMGILLIKYDYDSLGRNTEQRHYDIEGNLFSAKESGEWPGMIRYYYDDRNRLIKREEYQDANTFFLYGSPIQEMDYDNDGNLIETRYLDSNNQLYSGYSIERYEYKENRRITIRTEYDIENQLISRGNVAKYYTVFESSKRLNVIETRTLDSNNELVNVKDKIDKVKYAISKHTYFPDDDLRLTTFYNAKGKVVGKKESYYKYNY